MRKFLVILSISLFCITGYSQSIQEFFNKDIQVTWLGLDYTNCKIIGEWSQFNGAGEYGASEIRDKYFPAWNHLVLSEPDKYDLKSMIRQENIYIDIEMIMSKNAEVSIRNLEAYNPPNYDLDQIQEFVKNYDLDGRSGLGMVFINEYMSKYENFAVFHFVLLDMSTKEILLHQKCKGEPRGFGIRNYWAGSLHEVMGQIRKTHYPKWKRKYAN